MPAYGEQLLSKIVDAGEISALAKCGIEREHFQTEAERKAYDFIRTYANENAGAAPSYATFQRENSDITYIPAVTDSYEFLSRKVKDGAGKREIAELLNAEVAKRFETLDVETFAAWLTESVGGIMMKTRTNVPVGTNIATETERFLSEYRARKEGKSFRIWRSKFPSINEQIGGYFSGNTYAWYARSGRGKSILVMEDGALEPAFQGATVLVWALEMSEYEWMARACSSISARVSDTVEYVHGERMTVGFDNKALLMGALDDGYERGLEAFLTQLNEIIPGRIILRASDSDGFINRSIAQLESDIRTTGADVVVVDPIYLMDYEANTSRVAGGDVAATSVKLKRLAGQTKTVIHLVTQAEEDASEKSADGVREMKPPKRAELKKSKAILEDAANIFGIDTLANEGRGVIELGKGRNGGEDTRIELIYLPNYGIVREIPKGEEAIRQFTLNA